MTVAAPVDLTACDREPIQIPGSIQPHGALLSFREDDQVILQASANARDFLGLRADPMSKPTLAEALPEGADELAREVAEWSRSGDPELQRTVAIGARRLTAVAHRTGGLGVLEFERAWADEAATSQALYPRLRHFVEQVAGLSQVEAICQAAAVQVRRLTGFDRVLIYRFDADWNGTVVAEDRNEVLPSYLDLRFPASDIPSQARELYRRNRLRIIPDAGYTPSPILPPANPLTGAPLDLSQSVLRSVSPVHLEYMRNMRTLASMSVSILVDGELWGLISCHHAEPRELPLQVRMACDFLGQTLALQIGALSRTAAAARRVELATLQTRLLAGMAHETVFLDGLLKDPQTWLALVSATGAAVVSGGRVQTAGAAPSEADIRAIVAWLEEQGGPEFSATDSLCELMPAARRFADVASGVVSIHISRIHPSYVLWFRPEVVQTVTWGGDPRKPVEADAGLRLHPRKSFEQWRELVRGRSEPWSEPEMQAVRELRDAILAVVLRQAEERAELASELQRTNKELESFSYSVSHDLRAPFRHIVGYAELLHDREQNLDDKSRHYLRNIQEAAVSAGRLVDDLLNFSQIGRASLATAPVDMNKLVAEAQRSIARDLQGRPIEWRIGSLPSVIGDGSMLRQVFVNLISNAAKYTRTRPQAVIEIDAADAPDEVVFAVRDNGVGFDMAYVNKLFGVFQRLHRVEEFEGTGIGLAIARRVVERHGGRIWAEGELNRGAAFFFALPKVEAGSELG